MTGMFKTCTEFSSTHSNIINMDAAVIPPGMRSSVFITPPALKPRGRQQALTSLIVGRSSGLRWSSNSTSRCRSALNAAGKGLYLPLSIFTQTAAGSGGSECLWWHDVLI
jgi:hypothetical protein